MLYVIIGMNGSCDPWIVKSSKNDKPFIFETVADAEQVRIRYQDLYQDNKYMIEDLGNFDAKPYSA